MDPTAHRICTPQHHIACALQRANWAGGDARLGASGARVCWRFGCLDFPIKFQSAAIGDHKPRFGLYQHADGACPGAVTGHGPSEKRSRLGCQKENAPARQADLPTL